MTTTRPATAHPPLLAVLLTTLALAVGVVAATPAHAAPSAPNPPAKSSAAGTTWVRAAHLVPGVGTMTIRLVPFAGTSLADAPKAAIPEAEADGATRILEPAVGYGGIGEYRQVPAGLYAVTIRPVGSATDTPPVLAGTFLAQDGRAVTLAALAHTPSPRIDVLTDDLDRPAAGSASVRLIPAAPDATTTTVAAAGGPTLADRVPFGEPTRYEAVPAGRWTLNVSTTSDARPDRPTSAAVTVASGGVYSVFVLADGKGGVTVKPVVDALGLGSAPRRGVQTGGGGAATRPADPALGGGLALAGAGGLVLAGLGLRRRLQPVRRPTR
ncbi:DUF4397 domain-containing protein [Phycicoccus sp. HDW14]|uniref:DUF4397 domain-containing protein n=1 Tax=Phycicoccus sp. HDW14 TaxID=2714941 RepID=UPI00140B5D3F|nr:DUF4397 domain-containing protein [Phycicoccus sp. HDW14]QIM22748.1 DUF4397 domain-containing protein [Phycicoccus sp. HDW14]